MKLTEWLSLVLICVMGAMSPGPNLAVVLKHSLHGGMKNGMTKSSLLSISFALKGQVYRFLHGVVA